MLIIIPVKGNDPQKAVIARQLDADFWALVDFEDGVVKSVTFHKERKECGADWIDFAVLENKYENYMDLMEEGMMVLVRREGQDSIEDITEAFKFKELDEIGL